MQCFDGRSDDFTGDELDTDRWDGSVRVNQDLRVEDSHLVIPTAASDIYGTDNGNLPNIVLQDLPDGPFTATAKLTMPGSTAYQQGGLIIYGDDDNYAKMVLQGRDTAGPDPASRVFQFIREENGEPNEVGDSNTPALGADYPSTVWVRFTSDGEDLRASYSADGTEFTEMPETKSLAGIEDAKIGLLALQGSGRTQPPVDVSFDYFTITPDDSVAPATPNDEFDGNALDGCRWEVVRPDPEHMRVRDGYLELDATTGDIYGTDNGAPSNFVLQDLGDEDWTVETLVDGSTLTRQYEQGGLMVYVDDDNYVKFDISARNSPGSDLTLGLEVLSEVDGVIQNPQPAATVDQAVWYLRLEKSGDSFTGSYSADGEEWTSFEAVPNAPAAAGGRVGIFALGTASTDNQTVTFDYFRVLGEDPEPVEVTPGAVTFDDQPGTDSDTFTVPETEGVEYLVDGEVVGAGTYPGSGEVTVTARALEGFVLAEGATTEWTHTFSAEGEEPEPVEVTPAAVTFTDRPGFALDVFTVPAVEGVEYLVYGEVVPAGTYAGVGEVTVTAQALEGYVIAEGATTQWSHTFSTAGPAPDTRTAEFHLSNSWRGGTDVHFMYGRWVDEVFIGDWDGDGVDTIAVRRGNQFHVTNTLEGGDADVVFHYGRPRDVILVGDWDGDGRDSFAVRRGASYHINNSLRGGNADTVVTYGRGNDTVLVGDWDGDGVDTFAVRRGATYHVKNSLRGGDADVVFTYGRSGDVVLVGVWDGDGDDTLAVQRGRTFHVNNSLRGGDADRAVTFGRLGDEVHVGDWDGNGTDTLGIRRPVGGGVTATGFKPIGMVSKAG